MNRKSYNVGIVSGKNRHRPHCPQPLLPVHCHLCFKFSRDYLVHLRKISFQNPGYQLQFIITEYHLVLLLRFLLSHFFFLAVSRQSRQLQKCSGRQNQPASPIIFLNPCNCHPAQAKPVSCHCCHPFSRLEKFYSRQHRPALIRRRGKCHLARHLSDHFFAYFKPLLFTLSLPKGSLTSQFRHYRKLLSRNSGKHRHRFPRFNFQFFPLGSQIHSPFRQKSHKLSQIFCRDCDCPLLCHFPPDLHS